MPRRISEEAEDRNVDTGVTPFSDAVSRLLDQFRVVDRPPIEARRRTGFQPSLRKLQFLEPARERQRRRITGPASGVALQADVNAAIEKRPRGQDHRRAYKASAHLRNDAYHTVTFDGEVVARPLEKPKIRLAFETAPDRRAIEHPIGLRTRRAHSRTLRRIEDAKVNAGFVCGLGHGAAERVDLFDEMAFTDAADRWIATHLPECFERM